MEEEEDEVHTGLERQLMPSNERRISVGGIVDVCDRVMERLESSRTFGLRKSAMPSISFLGSDDTFGRALDH